jgi:hypothetical protein
MPFALRLKPLYNIMLDIPLNVIFQMLIFISTQEEPSLEGESMLLTLLIISLNMVYPTNDVSLIHIDHLMDPLTAYLAGKNELSRSMIGDGLIPKIMKQ